MAEKYTISRLKVFLGRRGTTIGIVLLGLAARLFYLIAIAHQLLVSDSARYYDMAVRLAKGQHFLPYWPPGLPLYLAAVSSLFGGSELVARLAMLPFYLLLCYALLKTVLSLSSEAACANLALLPLAFSPGMICLSVETTTETPAAALLMVVACSLIGLKRDKVGSAPWVLGVAIGWLALLRPASLALLLIVPFYLAWRSKSRFAALAVCLIPAVMVVAWVGYVHRGTGRVVPINTANARNFYLGNNPLTPLYRTWWWGSHSGTAIAPVTEETAMQLPYSKMAWDYIGRTPGMFALRTINRVCVFFAPDTYPGAYLIENYGIARWVGLSVIAFDFVIYLLLAGGSILYLAALPGSEDRGSVGLGNTERDGTGRDLAIRSYLLFVLCLLYASPYFIAFSHPRYRFPTEPLLMAAAAAFAFPFFKNEPHVTLQRLRGRRGALATAIVLLIAVQIEFVVMIVRAGLV